MRFYAIVFAAVVIGAQCRSLALSNVKDAEKKSAACVHVHRSARVHRDASKDAPSLTESSVSVNSVNSTDEKSPSNVSQELKHLIALYEENVAKLVKHARGICEDKNDNDSDIKKHKRQTNFQTQLGSLIERVVKEQLKVRNAYAKLGNVTDTTSWVPSKTLTIENVNNLRDLLDTVREFDIVYQDGEIPDEHIRIKRTNERYNRAASYIASGREEQIMHMLFDIQRQLTQIRKYLDKLCKKYYSTWTTTTEINPVNNVSLINQPNKVPVIRN